METKDFDTAIRAKIEQVSYISTDIEIDKVHRMILSKQRKSSNGLIGFFLILLSILAIYSVLIKCKLFKIFLDHLFIMN